MINSPRRGHLARVLASPTTAVPWLREHMIERSRTLALELAPTPSEFAERIQQLSLIHI